MKKTIIFIVMLMILAFAVSAETSVFSMSKALSGDSVCGDCYRQQQSVSYRSDGSGTYGLSVGNSVGDEGINFYVSYSCSPFTAGVERVEFSTSLRQYEADNWVNETINLTGDSSFSDFKKFFTMVHKDSLIVKMDTYFANGTEVLHDSPCIFETVIGSRGCSRCREVIYYRQEENIRQGNIIKGYSSDIIEKIYQVVMINFDLWVMLYWIFLIALLVSGVWLFFYLLFAAYNYLRHLLQGGKR